MRATILCFILLGAVNAHAQSAAAFGDKGTLTIAADRVMPLVAYTKETFSAGGLQQENTSSSISLFSYGVPTNIAYTIPRLAIDYAVVPNVTVGGSFMVFFDLSERSSTTFNGTTDSMDNPKTSGWAITPRAGYVMSLGGKIAFWPRGGLSYYSETVTNPPNGGGNNTSDGFHQFALDLEANLVILAAPHFMLMVGPVLDVPLSGSTTQTRDMMGVTTTTSYDYSQFHFGITAGVGGYL